MNNDEDLPTRRQRGDPFGPAAQQRFTSRCEQIWAAVFIDSLRGEGADALSIQKATTKADIAVTEYTKRFGPKKG